MTCADREGRLALLAGGEIEDAGLDQHVESCAVCAAFLEDLRDLRAVLAARPVEDEQVMAAGVRAAVLSSIRRRRAAARAIAVACVAASLLIAIFVTRFSRPVAEMPFAFTAPRPPQVQPVLQKSVPAPAKIVRARATPAVRKKGAPPAEQIVMKLITDDPNVVILWITD